MFITVEEMYAMREEYDKQIVELEMKKSVVNDFIALAEAKEQAKRAIEIETETETVEQAESYNGEYAETNNTVGY
jgi:hypothetical protein